MPNKTITIENNKLRIGVRSIAFEDIVGIRKITSSIIRQMGDGTIYCELFIRGGKSARISSKHDIVFSNSLEMEKLQNKEDLFFSLMNIVETRSPNIRENVSNWKEWRLILPIIIIQFIILLAGLTSGLSLDNIVSIGLTGSLLILPFSWFWERSARLKAWQ